MPDPDLLINVGFGEFVQLVRGTEVPVGVESLSVIIYLSPKGLGKEESCCGSAILFVGKDSLSFSKS